MISVFHRHKSKSTRKRWILGTFLPFFLVFLCGCEKSHGTFMTYTPNFIPRIYESEANAPGVVQGNWKLMGEELCVIEDGDSGIMAVAQEFDQQSVLAVREDDNTLLYQQNVYDKIYPASLTKLMTAYTVYALASDLEQEVTISEEALNLPDSAAKRCGLKKGDVITIHELLHAALIPSANDAAKALAVAVSGSEEAFVEKMNEFAKKLGATHSHFMNSHGLHADDHYTSLYDIYLIFHALLKNEDFISIVSLNQYEMTYRNSSDTEVKMTIASTNLYHTGTMQKPSFFSVIGGKTGTTNQAGSCIILSCQGQDGHSYILAVLNAADRQEMYSDLGELFESIEGMLH